MVDAALVIKSIHGHLIVSEKRKQMRSNGNGIAHIPTGVANVHGEAKELISQLLSTMRYTNDKTGSVPHAAINRKVASDTLTLIMTMVQV